MISEQSAGAIAFRGNPPRLLMIHDSYNRWTFPKGLIEPGEDGRDAAVRELAEETGVGGRILSELGVVRYFYTRPDKELVRKQVWFYLVEATGEEIKPQLEEIAGARWVSLEQAKKMLAYRNLQPVLGRAVRTLGALERGERTAVQPGKDKPKPEEQGR